MYCVNCGVKLAETEKKCPLCGVEAYHPAIKPEQAAPLYPAEQYPRAVSSFGLMVVLTTAFLMSMLITFLCDMQMSPQITWSGYVIGGLITAYCWFVLPFWFKKPNRVIFVPCDFAVAALLLLYIDLTLESNWFLSLALPVTGFTCLVVTTVITLLRYIRRGRLYIFGGAITAMGAFMLLLGFLVNLTFFEPSFTMWSLYPMTALALIGLMLIFLALCRPARETMQRKFFI